jgi:hypothetical protein
MALCTFGARVAEPLYFFLLRRVAGCEIVSRRTSLARFFLQARKGGQEFLFPGAFFPLTLEFQVQPYLKHLANQLACATLAS